MTTFENIGFALIALLIVFGFLITLPDRWNIISRYCEMREKKEAKQYPDFIAKLIEFEEEDQNYACLLMIKNEAKQNVDNLLVRINYAPSEKKQELIEQCEEAKRFLYNCEEECRVVSERLANKRNELERERKELGLRWN